VHILLKYCQPNKLFFCFVMTDAMLRANGYFLDVEPSAAYKFITEAMERQEFRFPTIRDWITSIIEPT
jgi:hypothetical protein